MPPGVDAQARPKNLLLSPNAYCAMVVALSIAVMSLAQDEPGLDRNVVLGSADMGDRRAFSGLGPASSAGITDRRCRAEFAAMLRSAATRNRVETGSAEQFRSRLSFWPRFPPLPSLKPTCAPCGRSQQDCF